MLYGTGLIGASSRLPDTAALCRRAALAARLTRSRFHFAAKALWWPHSAAAARRGLNPFYAVLLKISLCLRILNSGRQNGIIIFKIAKVAPHNSVPDSIKIPWLGSEDTVEFAKFLSYCSLVFPSTDNAD
ncbi:hypothetical protein ACJJTC_005361 [Scirpophaga incertulas]